MDLSGMEEYLRSTEVIDWHKPEIRSIAAQFSDSPTKTECAKHCFEWVRDEISHSFDVKAQDITSSASEALNYRTGICYSKTHLLAALLRAKSIPAGFGYQRIRLSNESEKFGLHGFNYVFLEEYGWYACDPRGNREGVDTHFAPPKVYLAFECNSPGEATLDRRFPDPLPSVLYCLLKAATVPDLRSTLPDLEESLLP